MRALEDMDESEKLKLLENAHIKRVGEFHFCYCPTEYTMEDASGHRHRTGMWRLSIVERNEPGHFPITEDLFFGTESAMKGKAAELNLKRLNLSTHEAARIIASSMIGAIEDRRRRRR